ncbi:MAG: hypothetical protein J7M16_00365 [Anaerolineae bacterium]|nr:hypothetical protein [Anaerolineae bacterium]
MSKLIRSVVLRCNITQFRAGMLRLYKLLGRDGWRSSGRRRLVFGEVPYMHWIYHVPGPGSGLQDRTFSAFKWRTDALTTTEEIKYLPTESIWSVLWWETAQMRPQYDPRRGIYQASIGAYEVRDGVRVDFLDGHNAEKPLDTYVMAIGEAFVEFSDWVLSNIGFHQAEEEQPSDVADELPAQVEGAVEGGQAPGVADELPEQAGDEQLPDATEELPDQAEEAKPPDVPPEQAEEVVEEEADQTLEAALKSGDVTLKQALDIVSDRTTMIEYAERGRGYDIATAADIMKAVVEAQDTLEWDGRWGPTHIAKYINNFRKAGPRRIVPRTVRNYLQAAYRRGIRTIDGVRLPYKPRRK